MASAMFYNFITASILKKASMNEGTMNHEPMTNPIGSHQPFVVLGFPPIAMFILKSSWLLGDIIVAAPIFINRESDAAFGYVLTRFVDINSLRDS